jgi:hypothetical protein
MLMLSFNAMGQHPGRGDIKRLDSVYVFYVLEGKTKCEKTRVRWGYDFTYDTLGFDIGGKHILLKKKPRKIFSKNIQIYEDLKFKEEHIVEIHHGNRKEPGVLIFITNIDFGYPSYVISNSDICTAVNIGRMKKLVDEKKK